MSARRVDQMKDNGRMFCPKCGTWMFFKKIIQNVTYKEMLFECDNCKERYFRKLPKGW